MQKLITSILFVLGLIYFIWKGLIPAWGGVQHDFPNYYMSSKLLIEGHEVNKFYDNDWFDNMARKNNFKTITRFTPFPPATALIMLPLARLSPITAKRAWMLLNVLVLFYIIYAFSRISRFSYLEISVVIFLLGAALANNFKLGQFYLVLVAVLTWIYRLYHHKKYRLAGFLLSLITLLKYFPIIFLAGFLKKRFWLITLISGFVLLGLQILILGWEATHTYVSILLSHLSGDIPGQGTHHYSYQSLDAFLSNIFITTEDGNFKAILHWPLGKSIVKGIFFITVFSLGYLILRKYRSDRPELRSDVYLIVAGISGLTILPASATYHFVLLIFPILLFLKISYQKIPVKYLIVLLVCLIAVGNTSQGTIPFRLGNDIVDLLLSFPRFLAMIGLYSMILYILIKHKPILSTEVDLIRNETENDF